jgi:hypothetical protein
MDARTLSSMTIFTTSKPLVWGEIDVPLFGLEKDLQGEIIQTPAAFCLVMDAQRLWFLANHRQPAQIHPQARPGIFKTELWQYDVAELFLADPESGRYFEFNLAPNGAWWSCEFTAPRVRAEALEVPMPDVATFSEMAGDGAWLAGMALPLDLLCARLDFGPKTRGNVAMILESPAQKFLSASDLSGGDPDFHQPKQFEEITFVTLPQYLP